MIDSREYDDSTIAQHVMLRHHIANLKRSIFTYHRTDYPEEHTDLINQNNVGVNVGVNLSDTQRKVYLLIKENPGITHSHIAATLSVSSKTAERATKALRDAGLIAREGSDKAGKWIIL